MWIMGSLSDMGREVCEELRKKMIDVRCLQEVRWRKQTSRMVEGRRFVSWWSGNCVVGVRDIVKEELCEKVVDVRRVSDKVMTVV